MNDIINTINKRKSVRAYLDQAIPDNIKESILAATLRAPTAGNMMHYSIIEINDQKLKDKLVTTCDNQPFIAKAPWVLLFLADYQRWMDYFQHCNVNEICEKMKSSMRKPGEGDFMMACNDTLIAAQTATIAAESYGLGSCYIGDIMENYEEHQKMFNLPEYVFPITMLCFGYPTKDQQERRITDRFDKEYIIFKDSYKRLNKNDSEKMLQPYIERYFSDKNYIEGANNLGQHFYIKKFNSEFNNEMTRSVNEALKNWK